MGRIRILVVVGAVVAVLAGGGVSAAGADQPAGTPGELLVAYDPDVAVFDEVVRAHERAGAEHLDRFEELSLDLVEVEDVDRALREYAGRPGVRYVERNATVHVAAVNDPLYKHQWHLHPTSKSNRGTANVEPAWKHSKGSGVVVAVVDTGVRTGGSDLDSRRVLKGRNFVANNDNATDDHGHGTHIAGTIAQSTDNGKGVAGVAPQARILPVKVLNSAGAGTYSNVIDGLMWAKSRADVINLSLSGHTFSQALCDAVSNAAREAVVVAAAGNDGLASISYPAACDDAAAVGAVRYDGKRSGYSNTGSKLDLVAPGGDLTADQNGDGHEDGILQQTYDGGWVYALYEGTSMAAAHVSGAAALVLAVNSRADVRSILTRTARDLGPKGKDNHYGHGVVDAAAAVREVVNGKASSTGGSGYWIASRDGRVHAFGGAAAHGSVSSGSTVPVVDIDATASGKGYWVLDEAGGVHVFGDAPYRGSLAELRAQGHVPAGAKALGIASTPTGGGYWILDAAGGIFTFGDARFHGSVPGLRQNGISVGPARVVGIASTSTGSGYWILDEFGGMFAFGDARFFGSVPGLRQAGHAIGPATIVGMAPTATGKGYWLVDDQGGMFAFGDARFHGSIPGLRQAGHAIGKATIAGMEPTRSGGGYWLIDDRGGVFTFGDARFHGSLPSIGVSARATGIAPT